MMIVNEGPTSAVLLLLIWGGVVKNAQKSMTDRKDSAGMPSEVKAKLESLERERREKRLEYALQSVAKGDLSQLANLEFLGEVLRLLSTGAGIRAEFAGGFADGLIAAMIKSDIETRTRLLPIVYHLAAHSLQTEDDGYILCAHGILKEWLVVEEDAIPGVETLGKVHESLVEWLLFAGHFDEVKASLQLWREVSEDHRRRPAVLRGMAGKCLEAFTKKSILTFLCTSVLNSTTTNRDLEGILEVLSPASTINLLQMLEPQTPQDQKTKLIGILVHQGSLAVPGLERFAAECQETRDLLLVLQIARDIGGEELLPLATTLVHHKDEAIQLASIGIIVEHGGEQKLGHLLAALELVSDSVKLHLLKFLLGERLDDPLVRESFVALGRRRVTFAQQHFLELMLAILVGLKRNPSRDSLQLLYEFKDEAKSKGWDRQLSLGIQEAINTVEPVLRRESRNMSGDDGSVQFVNDPVEQQLAAGKIREVEERVASFLAEENTKEAGVFVYNQAVMAANQRDYAVAEKLRDRLLEIDPFALTEVVRLGELIDENKSGAITSQHLEIWHDLCSQFPEDTYAALYHNCRLENYRPGDILVKSGEIDNSLFFLNSGTISMTCETGGREVFLRKYTPGNILGAEHFFSASVWTVTLVAMTEVQVHVLERKSWELLVKRYPQLSGQLQDFCQRYAKAADLLKMSGDERRRDFRHPISVPSRHILIDHYGQKSERSCRGQLLDISNSGVAFTLKMATREMAQDLLGRQLVTSLEVQGEKEEITGVVVGVRPLDPVEKLYSVHVKLAEDNRRIVSKIVGAQ
jgi:CRP-like cAMP-binding protein